MKPWLKEQWCIPPEANAEFVWHREDVLDVYTRPYDPTRPQVCLDETSRQLLAETRPPRPPAPGRPARHDPEYARGGVVNLFLVTEPLAGRRHVLVSEQRTRLDWAHGVRALVDVHSPEAAQVVLVMDQLNTHSPASLDEAFPPAEAKRLAAKLEIHHTPKHGSWLNMAEIELSVLARQCGVPPGPPSAGRPADRGAGGGGVGRRAQRRDPTHRLALHDGGRPDQAQASLPSISRVTDH